MHLTAHGSSGRSEQNDWQDAAAMVVVFVGITKLSGVSAYTFTKCDVPYLLKDSKCRLTAFGAPIAQRPSAFLRPHVAIRTTPVAANLSDRLSGSLCLSGNRCRRGGRSWR